MDGEQIVEQHGLVLQSARGPVPNMPELVVGEPVTGSWWAHPDHDEIFRVLNEAVASPDVVRCRLVGGKVTLVHRRLWPALVRLSDRIDHDALASVVEEHTSTGAHRKTVIPFSDWIPSEIVVAASSLTEAEARAQLPAGVVPDGPPRIVER